MKTLDEIRIELDEVDQAMRQLFEKRMALVLEVKHYKKAHNLPILDSNRETHMLNYHLDKLDNKALKSYYESFLKHVMELSKAYQV
jgi:monofunctional chorismate mutase